MPRNIQLLDCTLRDGGNGLEELEKNGNKDAYFEQSTIKALITHLSKTKADIIEIGSILQTTDDRTRFAEYRTIEGISSLIEDCAEENVMYAAMYRVPDVPLDTIPEWRPGLCRAVRVVLRYSELDSSLAFCEGLAQKNYKVFIQPMVTMRYTDDDLAKVIGAANRMGAYALYFVDSYGCMDFTDIERLTKIYSENLDDNIKLGFHAHNNMAMAFANAAHFISVSTRDIIVDSCVMGMGLSAGNLQTEIIAPHLTKYCGKELDMTEIIRACEEVVPLYEKGLWGYSLDRVIPALRRSAYKYAPEYKNVYGLPLSEIYELMDNMPDDYRFRFTKDYAKDWYEKNKGSNNA